MDILSRQLVPLLNTSQENLSLLRFCQWLLCSLKLSKILLNLLIYLSKPTCELYIILRLKIALIPGLQKILRHHPDHSNP